VIPTSIDNGIAVLTTAPGGVKLTTHIRLAGTGRSIDSAKPPVLGQASTGLLTHAFAIAFAQEFDR
jgi:hypothetical protein